MFVFVFVFVCLCVCEIHGLLTRHQSEKYDPAIISPVSTRPVSIAYLIVLFSLLICVSYFGFDLEILSVL